MHGELSLMCIADNGMLEDLASFGWRPLHIYLFPPFFFSVWSAINLNFSGRWRTMPPIKLGYEPLPREPDLKEVDLATRPLLDRRVVMR